MKKILLVFGTRPEAVKMIPIYQKLTNDDRFSTAICLTAQHREMLDNVMNFFGIQADYDLNIMQKNQSLEMLSSKLLLKVSAVLDDYQPDLVLVHGDTTTSFITALSAFYKKIDVAHIEAGLRTNDIYSPFPEEVNRQLTARIAKFHFAPTLQAKTNLIQEGITPQNIFVVGNSVIDSLFLTLHLIQQDNLEQHFQQIFQYPVGDNRIVLITGHRRENFGEGFLNICHAVKELADKYPNVDFVYPVHLNPNVQTPVKTILSDIKNVFLIEPLNYESFVYLMSRSYLILTDSGGIQEEAPSLGKPVLVMRDTTERPEAIQNGTVKLVGTSKNTIIESVSTLLESIQAYEAMATSSNPYGDGTTCEQIVNILGDSL